jgi:hypothetical protein
MAVDLGGRQFATGSLKILPDETNLLSCSLYERFEEVKVMIVLTTERKLKGIQGGKGERGKVVKGIGTPKR